MNFKDYLFAFSFALGTTLLFQYFFGSTPVHIDSTTSQEIVSGESFVAPVQESLHKPLNTHVQLQHVTSQEELTIVTTSLATYTFSNHGAVLKETSFKNLGSGDIDLSTLQKSQAFLVALDTTTPMAYELVSQEETEALVRLVYKAHLHDGQLYKTFDVYKEYYQIDVSVEVKNAHHASYDCRLFLSAPKVALDLPANYETTLSKDDVKRMHQALHTLQMINTEENFYHNDRNPGKLIKMDCNDKKMSYEKYWAAPTCFLLTDKYFIHGLIGVGDKPVRGYVSAEKTYKEMIFDIPSLANTNWKASFYVGPKEVQAMQQVDERLEQTLNYGWFGFIAKPLDAGLFYLNEYIHNYGWCIILLTFLLKLLMLPFTWSAEGGRRKSVDFQKKLAYLQQKYQHDRTRLDYERAELIKKHGLPGIGSCLPLLLTFPVFIALNNVLKNSLNLYAAPFLWVPNLAAHDPYYIIPVLVGLVMLANPTYGDGDIKQAFSKYALALLFVGFVAHMSAGLALFIFTNVLLSVMQMMLQKKVSHA